MRGEKKELWNEEKEEEEKKGERIKGKWWKLRRKLMWVKQQNRRKESKELKTAEWKKRLYVPLFCYYYNK